MRLDAHPLMVAVALGLLGPAALSTDSDDDDRLDLSHHESPLTGSDAAGSDEVEKLDPVCSPGADPLPGDAS
jgi:hypothetical protein